MKTTKQILCLLCSLVCACGLSAQTITGKLTDEQNQPLPYANVVILSLPDSAFVNGTVSAEDGSFSLNATASDQIIRTLQWDTTPSTSRSSLLIWELSG